MRFFRIYAFLALFLGFAHFNSSAKIYAIELWDASGDFLSLKTHKPFYYLPFYHSFTRPYDTNERGETRFQISFKMPVFSQIFSDVLGFNDTFYYAYTQSAWFQNYNPSNSRPFRDIDYAPEFFYEISPGWRLGDFIEIERASFGYIHISNGERIARSRTSNRMLMSTRMRLLEAFGGAFYAEPRLWAFIGQSSKEYKHDNADLHRYWGYGELMLAFKNDNHIVEFELRPIISARFRPRIQLGYTFALASHFGLYFFAQHGYGDNMFEYNYKSTRAGIGVRYFDF